MIQNEFYDFSHLPLYKLRLTKSPRIFYHFIVCYFLVCKSPEVHGFKFRLDCSLTCMVIDPVICEHLKFTFPNLCRKDIAMSLQQLLIDDLS